ncbi:MAG: hypothetical protein QM664_01820 [Flavihumibacter sp.]
MKRYVIVVLCLALLVSFASKSNAQQASVNIEHFSFPEDASFNYGPASSGIQSISAVFSKNRVNIAWAASKGMSHNYIMQRSTDGEHFENLNGRAENEAGHFSYSDYLPAKAMKLRDVYYRIGWRNAENSFSYTKPMLIRVARNGSVDCVSVFPDPEKNDIHCQLELADDSYMIAELTDDAGARIMTKEGKLGAGKQVLGLTGTSQLAKGTYWLEIRVNSKEAMKVRLIKE